MKFKWCTRCQSNWAISSLTLIHFQSITHQIFLPQIDFSSELYKLGFGQTPRETPTLIIYRLTYFSYVPTSSIIMHLITMSLTPSIMSHAYKWRSPALPNSNIILVTSLSWKIFTQLTLLCHFFTWEECKNIIRYQLLTTNVNDSFWPQNCNGSQLGSSNRFHID